MNHTTYRSLDRLGEDPRVAHIDDEEDDGLWVYLNDGYCNGDWACHIIHEDTVREILSKAMSIKPCQCCQACEDHWKPQE